MHRDYIDINDPHDPAPQSQHLISFNLALSFYRHLFTSYNSSNLPYSSHTYSCICVYTPSRPESTRDRYRCSAQHDPPCALLVSQRTPMSMSTSMSACRPCQSRGRVSVAFHFGHRPSRAGGFSPLAIGRCLPDRPGFTIIGRSDGSDATSTNVEKMSLEHEHRHGRGAVTR